MNWREHIHSVPGIGSGEPIFKGTRFSVRFLLKLMAEGWDERRIAEQYPGLNAEHMRAAAAFAAEMIGDETYVAMAQAKVA